MNSQYDNQNSGNQTVPGQFEGEHHHRHGQTAQAGQYDGQNTQGGQWDGQNTQGGGFGATNQSGNQVGGGYGGPTDTTAFDNSQNQGQGQGNLSGGAGNDGQWDQQRQGAGAGGVGGGQSQFDDNSQGQTNPDDGAYGGQSQQGGKPGFGDKLMGSLEKAAGKTTRNPGMAERGQERKTGGQF